LCQLANLVHVYGCPIKFECLSEMHLHCHLYPLCSVCRRSRALERVVSGCRTSRKSRTCPGKVNGGVATARCCERSRTSPYSWCQWTICHRQSRRTYCIRQWSSSCRRTASKASPLMLYAGSLLQIAVVDGSNNHSLVRFVTRTHGVLPTYCVLDY